MEFDFMTVDALGQSARLPAKLHFVVLLYTWIMHKYNVKITINLRRKICLISKWPYEFCSELFF
jgi:hypothetical protein